jgi:hypothetical protein
VRAVWWRLTFPTLITLITFDVLFSLNWHTIYS